QQDESVPSDLLRPLFTDLFTLGKAVVVHARPVALRAAPSSRSTGSSPPARCAPLAATATDPNPSRYGSGPAPPAAPPTTATPTPRSTSRRPPDWRPRPAERR